MGQPDVQATFCATLVDEWIRLGVSTAVIAPGSRSTPIVTAIADRDELAVHVVHDERSAAFVALGVGLAGRPGLLVCTSGTAAANFHPAVIEAGLSAVPMLVVTADRPSELRGVGAPQTIDQTHLFGGSVRWFHDPGVPDPAAQGSWRSLARRAWRSAAGVTSLDGGPVHLNLPFREPLLGAAGPLPEPYPLTPRPDSVLAPTPAEIDAVAAIADRQRGVIVAGGRSGVAPAAIAGLSDATSWPVLADPASGARHLPTAVPSFDPLLRHRRFAVDHAPDVVVRIGRPPASRVLAEWLGSADPLVVQIGGPGEIDPDHRVSAVLAPAGVEALAVRLGGATNTTWQARWRTASERAEAAISAFLAREDALSEPGAARVVAEWLPDDMHMVVASSMPVRDLEWFGGRRARALANRGANGIDGVISTAVGIATGGAPVVALVGDIALVHDAGALTALAGRGLDVRIVVVDNDGGGIFSFLPQASEMPGDRFEQLFGTPHGTDLEALAAAHGLRACAATTRDALIEAVARPGPGCVRVPSERARNVEVHAALNQAVSDALG
jgi:2-succinyl-5-enolpyruvyl-6-hydroxy-3-cyclohexene-1-carboxylate synthase